MYKFFLKSLPVAGLFMTWHYYNVRFCSPMSAMVNNIISYLLYGFIIIGVFSYIIHSYHNIKKQYPVLLYIFIIFFIYVLWGIVKLFTEQTLTHYQVFSQCASLLAFGLVFIFGNSDVFRRFNQVSLKYLPFIFLIIILPFYIHNSYLFFFTGIYFWVLFYKYSSRYNKILLLVLIFCSLFVFFSERTQLIRLVVSICIFLLYHRIYKSKLALNIINWSFYLLPLIFVLLTFTGTFNIMDIGDKIEINRDGENLLNLKDSRDILYEEAVVSAVKNNSILFGRSPACGYDTEIFLNRLQNIEGGQRSSECYYVNVFTWMGVFGLVLFHILFISTSYRAINKSNNRLLPLIGIMISFNSFCSWITMCGVEIGLDQLFPYIMIGMSLSNFFMKSTDVELDNYLKTVFGKTKLKIRNV